MEVDSRYLENAQSGNEGSGIWGAAASVYGYSSLDMLAQYRKSGRMFIPWTRAVVGGKGLGMSMVGKLARNRGNALIGVGRYGRMLMGASRVAGLTNAAFVATDPIWFATSFLGNPLMLAAGAAWFGGGAVLGSVGRALEARKYVRMNTPFEDTEQSYTSRQRAVRAIAESHLQARSAIGNEAQLFHR